MRLFAGATAFGSIELSVTERTAAATELQGWKRRVARMDRTDALADVLHRSRVVPMSTVKMAPDAVVVPLRSEDHEPVKVARDARIDAEWDRVRYEFWRTARDDMSSRVRGVPGNVAPGSGKSCGE